jgi:hypothetical protein
MFGRVFRDDSKEFFPFAIVAMCQINPDMLGDYHQQEHCEKLVIQSPCGRIEHRHVLESPRL